MFLSRRVATIAGLLAVSTLTCLPRLAHAQTPGLTGFTGGSPFPTFDNDGDNIGWSFTANSDITLTNLGFWDSTPADPLASPHEVGIWDNTGTLLRSITVGTSAPLTDGFRYTAVAPLALSSGSTYVIGAFLPVGNTDTYMSSVATLTTSADITFVSGRGNFGPESSLALPGVTDGVPGRFGPNFLYTATIAAVAAPEPGSLALLGMAGLPLAGMVVRRRKATLAK